VITDVAVIEPDTGRIRNHVRSDHLDRSHRQNIGALACDLHRITVPVSVRADVTPVDEGPRSFVASI
jgi:hypothetical protein